MGDALDQGTFYVGDLLPEAGKPQPKLGADPNKVDRSAAEGPYFPVAASAGDEVVTKLDAGATVFDGDSEGLSAFLLDNCVDGTDGGAMSAADANTVAAALLAEMRSGNALDSSSLEAVIQATDAQVTVAASGGDDFVEGVLKCLAGFTYSVADEIEVQDAMGAAAAAGGSFDDDSNRVASQVSSSLSLTKSLASGQLSGFCDAAFSYGGTAGAALVVYDDDGSVL